VTIVLQIDEQGNPAMPSECDVAGLVEIESSIEMALDSVEIEKGSDAVVVLPAGTYWAVANDNECDWAERRSRSTQAKTLL
jgi:hypothetical protein